MCHDHQPSTLPVIQPKTITRNGAVGGEGQIQVFIRCANDALRTTAATVGDGVIG